jgi:hypothetical protein
VAEGFGNEEIASEFAVTVNAGKPRRSVRSIDKMNIDEYKGF